MSSKIINHWQSRQLRYAIVGESNVSDMAIY
jgi:hypothetical protein